MNLLLKQLIQFGVPMAIANMTPIFVKGKLPIDFGKTLKGKRFLGDGKTFEGTIVGICVGTLVGYLLGNALLGFAVSSGALLGDMVESFFKRRTGRKRGESWWGFDQLDFVIGAIAVGSLVAPLMIKTAILLIVVSLPGHMLLNYIGYKLKVKKNKW